MTRYSVAISPPDRVIEQVRQLKQQLRAAIGDYHSMNANAHISFAAFLAHDNDLHHYETRIARFAARQQPVSLLFDHTDTFEGGTFFLAPDTVSSLLLTTMMKDFLWSRYKKYSAVPHMSIGRRLTPEQLFVAGALIPEADIGFICSDLVLRRFNPDRKQYDIYRRFAFGGGGIV